MSDRPNPCERCDDSGVMDYVTATGMDLKPIDVVVTRTCECTAGVLVRDSAVVRANFQKTKLRELLAEPNP